MATYATLGGGNVVYEKTDAAIPIQEFIDALLAAQEDGATHVLGLSGNYRGAQYVDLGLPEIDYDLDDDDEDDE